MRYTLLLSILVFIGCTPIATYPPVENAVALSFANSANEPVPTIMAEILAYSHEHFGGMELIVFNLPGGVSGETYNLVADKLAGAIPMLSPNELAYHIIELRVRGFSADADVIFPSTSGGYEMATVYLKSSLISPWAVTRDRVWLIPTQVPPMPNYSVEEIAEVETDSQ